MTDADILDRIDMLARRQQEIYRRHSRADRRESDALELQALKAELDRCWGARRCRRALREAERFADDGLMPARSPVSTVDLLPEQRWR
jgi:uncharacterized protein DUF2630